MQASISNAGQHPHLPARPAPMQLHRLKDTCTRRCSLHLSLTHTKCPRTFTPQPGSLKGRMWGRMNVFSASFCCWLSRRPAILDNVIESATHSAGGAETCVYAPFECHQQPTMNAHPLAALRKWASHDPLTPHQMCQDMRKWIVLSSSMRVEFCQQPISPSPRLVYRLHLNPLLMCPDQQ